MVIQSPPLQRPGVLRAGVPVAELEAVSLPERSRKRHTPHGRGHARGAGQARYARPPSPIHAPTLSPTGEFRARRGPGGPQGVRWADSGSV
ncbi:hypothetical protein GCM10008959_08030 [Deinococcus seoulensis]|uniref:Uncharacterized protein n=1 Tax=Deinococcus seoulensis TaxID=1837379 RepID=A0ABQ2RRY0_9DEIO|nr:hypothetical protein GCM10008959_08030 [Deinococcus seoulensis]